MAGDAAAGTGTATGAAGDPPAGSANQSAGGATPPATPPAGGADEGAGSHRQVLAELADERKRRQQMETELNELKSRTQTDAEKALEKAKKEGAAEATQAANRRIVRSEIKAAAGGKVQDPEDVAALLGDLDRFIVKDEVDSKAIAAAIDALVKDKPYLAAAGAPGKARPLPGGGASQPSGFSLNDDIRARAGRG